jgi:hypothetical protein
MRGSFGGPSAAPDLPIRAGVVYAIRARTRAQIESTQIVRPRPHRTRGGLVEGVRGTGDLSTLGHRDGGAPELAICSMHVRTEGVPERARDRATPVPPNAGMMAHGVAAHPLRASLCGLAATGNRLSASGQFAMPPTLRYEARPWFMWRATSAVRQVDDVGERVAALPTAMSVATPGGCASARSSEPPPDHTARVLHLRGRRALLGVSVEHLHSPSGDGLGPAA